MVYRRSKRYGRSFRRRKAPSRRTGFFKRKGFAKRTKVRKYMRAPPSRLAKSRATVITISRRNYLNICSVDPTAATAVGKKIIVRISANHPGNKLKAMNIQGDNTQPTQNADGIRGEDYRVCDKDGVLSDVVSAFNWSEANPPENLTTENRYAVGLNQFVGDPNSVTDTTDLTAEYRQFEVLSSTATLRIEPMQNQTGIGASEGDKGPYKSGKYSVFAQTVKSNNAQTGTPPTNGIWTVNEFMPTSKDLLVGEDPFEVQRINQSAKRVDGYCFRDIKNPIVQISTGFGAGQRAKTPFPRRALSYTKHGGWRPAPPGLEATYATPQWKHLTKDMWEHRFAIVPETIPSSALDSASLQQGQLPDLRIFVETVYKIKLYNRNTMTEDLKLALRLHAAQSARQTWAPADIPTILQSHGHRTGWNSHDDF